MKWYNNLNISWKFVLSFSVILIFLAATGTLGLYNANRMNGHLDEIYNERLVAVSELGTVSTHVQKVNTGLGSLLLSTDENERNHIKAKVEASKQKIDEAVQRLFLINLSGNEIEQLKLFTTLWSSYWPEADKIIELIDNNQTEFASTIYQRQLLNRMEGIDRIFQDFLDLNRNSAGMAYSNSKSIFNEAIQWSVVIMSISLLLSALLGYLMTASIRKPVKALLRISEQIGRGILSQEIIIGRNDELGELGAAFEKMRVNLTDLVETVQHSTHNLSGLSVQIQQQADATGKSSQTVYEGLQNGAEKSREQSEKVSGDAIILKELALGLQQVAGSIDSIGIHSIEMEQASETGAIVVRNAVEKISHVQEQVQRSYETIRDLGQLSKEIEDVVITIKSISEETNLLSLNASIEAARAGEAGRGFAVVAQEVRKLAENSIRAVDHVSNVVANIQKRTEEAIRSNQLWISEMNEGQEMVYEAGQAFSDIESRIQKINMNIQDVSASVEELAAGSNEIDSSIRRIEQFSSYSAQSSQEYAAVSSEQIHSMDNVALSVKRLLEITQEIKSVMNRFVLNKT